MTKRHLCAIFIVAAIAGASAILTMLFADRRVANLVAAIWLVGLPFWFWLEYTFLVSEDVKNDPRMFERLKYSQELASKFWLGVSAALAALHFVS